MARLSTFSTSCLWSNRCASAHSHHAPKFGSQERDIVPENFPLDEIDGAGERTFRQQSFLLGVCQHALRLMGERKVRVRLERLVHRSHRFFWTLRVHVK